MKNKQYIVVICHGEATVYSSIKDAAEVVGVHRNTLAGYMRQGVRLEAGEASVYPATYVKSKSGGKRTKKAED